MKTITESVKTRIVIIPSVAFQSPVLSKLVWLGPDDLPTNITTSAVLQLNGVIYKHRIISTISGLEDETFGEYKLLYEGKVLTNVFIRREGQILPTSTMFISGNVIFKWTSSNCSSYGVFVTRDHTRDSNWTLSKVKAQIGGSAIIRWTASSFPSTGQYLIYHRYKENRTILSINSSGVNYGEDTQTTKYAYTSRPFSSTNIVFEIRDITLDDAGYYNGGLSADAAWAGGGVVLIVSAKPEKPDIKGNLTTLVDTYLKLSCISKSTSTPDYYYKFRSLSYTWYINDTKIKEEFEETIRLSVTRWHRYNRYSCTATEEGLESDRNGPEKLTFTPKPTFDKGYKFTVKEGDEVGPIFCSADCNPPCNVSWKYKESNGLKDALSENGILLLQSVNRNVTQIICLSRWKTESMEKDIALDVQYIDDPIINVNGEWVSDRISVDIQERKPLHLSCFVNGNPTPSVRLGKSQNGRTTILSEAMDHWSNYSLSTGAKCSDTRTYVCYGKSQSTNLKTNKSIGVNILCEPRLDKEAQLKTLTDLAKARVLIIPVIAYPPPDLSKLVWLAPNNLPSTITANAVIQSNDIIYKHRVITIVSGLEDEHYGEYKLLYNRKFLISVIIRKEEDAEDGPLRANIVGVAVPSTLLGITWILLIIYVVFQKWRRNLKTTHQHDEKVNQLETPSMEQHYDDLQDIDVERNYSHLDRLDKETPYVETL
uniref:Ig-like domain-containing protein n=1 Tax=Magallana gigas TaxID=29159 RepID=A0A8W8J2B0_MAGGI